MWDRSRTGLYLIAKVQSLEATSCKLILTEVVRKGMFIFQAQLMWFSDGDFQTYLGMKFESSPELPPNTFLERYLKTNFDV